MCNGCPRIHRGAQEVGPARAHGVLDAGRSPRLDVPDLGRPDLGRAVGRVERYPSRNFDGTAERGALMGVHGELEFDGAGVEIDLIEIDIAARATPAVDRLPQSGARGGRRNGYLSLSWT